MYFLAVYILFLKNYPVIAGIEDAHFLFNVVFVITMEVEITKSDYFAYFSRELAEKAYLCRKKLSVMARNVNMELDKIKTRIDKYYKEIVERVLRRCIRGKMTLQSS